MKNFPQLRQGMQMPFILKTCEGVVHLFIPFEMVESGEVFILCLNVCHDLYINMTSVDTEQESHVKYSTKSAQRAN